MSFYKFFFCVILLIFTIVHTSLANSNNPVAGAIIQGKLMTSDNKPAEEVLVVLSLGSKTRTAITNESGYFEFNGLVQGIYHLSIPFVGYETIKREITILKEEKIQFTFHLKLYSKQLQDVIVASKQKKLSIGKINIPDKDLPLSVGIINNKIITDQQATRVGDIIKNVPGVSLVQTRFGVNETYGARGYTIGNTGGAGGGSVFKNGLPYNIAGMPEATSLESVEIIKGSSAFLYGSSSGGLIINMVSKKPKFDFGGSLSMSSGSHQQYKPTLDIYGPISKKLAYRLVSSYENDNSFRDRVKTIRTYINPSFLYKIGEKSSILLQQDYLNAQLTPDPGVGLLDSGRILTTLIPRSRFQNTKWAYNNVIQRSTSISYKHLFNDRFSLNASTSVQNSNVDSYGAGNLNTANKIGVIARTLARAHSVEEVYASQINLEGRFRLNKIENHFVSGIDFTQISTYTDSYSVLNINGTILKTYDTINLLIPNQYTQRVDIPSVTKTAITLAPSKRAGIYLQDLISLTNSFKIFAGLRYSYQATMQTTMDSMANQKRPAISVKGNTPTTNYFVFSPKAGFVFQPTNNASLYISYANNFTTNTGIDINGNLLPASIIDQFELGSKQSFLKGRLIASMSIYKIINSNLAQQAPYKADGITPNTDANVKMLSGETTSKGLEIGLNGTISRNLYFITGYGFNNIQFTHTSGLKGANIEGEPLVNTPNSTANASIFYSFENSKLRGLKLGLSGFYIGKRFGGYNNTIGQGILGSRMIPLSDYSTIDLSIGYELKHVRIMTKLSNIFNSLNYLVHDNYSITPIAPRQVSLNISYRF